MYRAICAVAPIRSASATLEINAELAAMSPICAASSSSAARALVVEHDRLERERQVAGSPRVVRRSRSSADAYPRRARPRSSPDASTAAPRRASAPSRPGAALARRAEERDAPRSSCWAAISRSSRSGPAMARPPESMIASRSAMATACVRVSASSFVRMCRTWLFTVSCEMKSWPRRRRSTCPSASSCRISRSRGGEHVVVVACPTRNCGHQRRVDVALALRDLLDRAHERLVRRLLEDVPLSPRLEPRD